MFRCSYTTIKKHINALPDDGLTVTPKNFGTVLMYIFM